MPHIYKNHTISSMPFFTTGFIEKSVMRSKKYIKPQGPSLDKNLDFWVAFPQLPRFHTDDDERDEKEEAGENPCRSFGIHPATKTKVTTPSTRERKKKDYGKCD